MNAFLIELDDKVGEVARIAEAIAAKDINISGFSGSTAGGKGSVVLLVEDEAGARSALNGLGCMFKEVEVTQVPLPNVPGSLAKATRRLADAGINIEAALPMGMEGNNITVGFATSDPAKTKAILATAGSAMA